MATPPPFVGGFPGDEEKNETINELRSCSTLIEAFGNSAEAMCKALENLPYSARIGVVSKLASTTRSEDARSFVERLLGAPSSAAHDQTDSEDDDLVQVFGPPNAHAPVAYDRRQLALHIAAASNLSDTILAELDRSAKLLRKFALDSASKLKSKSSTKKTFLVEDVELVERILGRDTKVKDQSELLSSCVTHRRVSVLDEVLPKLVTNPSLMARFLHGASSNTVKNLLLKCRNKQGFWCHTLKWVSLWRFHGPYLLGVLKEELSSKAPLKKEEIWSKWFNSCNLKIINEVPAKEICELLFAQPPYISTLSINDSQELSSKVGEELSADPLSWPPILLSSYVPLALSNILERLNISNAIDMILNLSKDRLLSMMPVVSILLLSIKKTSSRQCQAHYAKLKSLICEFTTNHVDISTMYDASVTLNLNGNISLHNLCNVHKCVRPSDADISKFKFRIGLCVANAICNKLSSSQILDLASHFKAFARNSQPTTARFMADSDSSRGGGSLLSTLVPHTMVESLVSEWVKQVTSFPLAACEALCARYYDTNLKSGNVALLNETLASLIDDHLLWAYDVVAKCGLEKVWEDLDDIIGQFKVLNQFSGIDAVVTKVWPKRTFINVNEYVPSVLCESVEMLIRKQILSIDDLLIVVKAADSFVSMKEAMDELHGAVSTLDTMLKRNCLPLAYETLFLVIRTFSYIKAYLCPSMSQVYQIFMNLNWNPLNTSGGAQLIERLLKATVGHRIALEQVLDVLTRAKHSEQEQWSLLNTANTESATLLSRSEKLLENSPTYAQISEKSKVKIVEITKKTGTLIQSQLMKLMRDIFDRAKIKTNKNFLDVTEKSLNEVLPAEILSAYVWSVSIPSPESLDHQHGCLDNYIYWDMLREAPDWVRHAEHEYINWRLSLLQSTVSVSNKCTLMDVGMSYLKQNLHESTQKIIVRYLRGSSLTTASNESYLLTLSPIEDPGVRKALQSACSSRDPVERCELIGHLIVSTLNRSDGDYTPAQVGNRKHPLTVEVDRASDRLKSMSETLIFVTKRIANEQLPYRHTILVKLLGEPEFIAKNLLLGCVNEKDISLHRNLYLGLLEDTLSAIALTQNGSHACTSLWERFAVTMVQTAIILKHHEVIPDDRREALLDFGAEILWRVMKATKSKKALQDQYYINSYNLYGQEAIPVNRIVDMLLRAYGSRLDMADFGSTSAPRLETLIKHCGMLYYENPTVKSMVERVLSNCESKQDEVLAKKVSETITKYYPQNIIFEGSVKHYSPKPGHLNSWYCDKLLPDFFERELLQKGSKGKYWEEYLEALIDYKFARKDVVTRVTILGVHQSLRDYDNNFNVKKSQKAFNRIRTIKVSREATKARQLRYSSAVAYLMNLCQNSAIYNADVQKHLLMWRQDLLEDKYLVADERPYGVFKAEPFSDPDDDDFSEYSYEEEEEDETGSWRWPVSQSDSLLYTRVAPGRLALVRSALLEDALDPNIGIQDRTVAATNAMLLPGVDSSASLKQLLDFTKESNGTPIDKEGEVDANTESSSPLPKPVVQAFLHGLMNSDEPMDAVRYMLQPHVIDHNRKLGLNPMEVISRATSLLRPHATCSMLRSLLKDHRRARALGLGGIKDAIRMLFELQSPEGHAVIIDSLGWLATRHPDVKSVAIHSILSMLDISLCPQPQIDVGRIDAALGAVVANPEIPSDVKVVLLCTRCGSNCRSKNDADLAFGRKLATLPRCPTEMDRLLTQKNSFTTIEISSTEHALIMGKITLALCDSPSPLVPTKVAGEDQLIEEKKKAAILKEHARLLSANDDLQCLALCHLDTFAGLSEQQGEGSLDELLGNRLNMALSSSQTDSIFDSNNADGKQRVEIRESTIVEELVFICARESFSPIMLQSRPSVPELIGAAKGALPEVVDKCLKSLIHRKAFDMDHDERTMACRRLATIRRCLESSEFARGAFCKESDAGSQKLAGNLCDAILIKRCEKELTWLKNEAKAISSMTNFS